MDRRPKFRTCCNEEQGVRPQLLVPTPFPTSPRQGGRGAAVSVHRAVGVPSDAAASAFALRFHRGFLVPSHLGSCSDFQAPLPASVLVLCLPALSAPGQTPFPRGNSVPTTSPEEGLRAPWSAQLGQFRRVTQAPERQSVGMPPHLRLGPGFPAGSSGSGPSPSRVGVVSG